MPLLSSFALSSFARSVARHSLRRGRSTLIRKSQELVSRTQVPLASLSRSLLFHEHFFLTFSPWLEGFQTE